jgi:cobalt-zinc-cadmium efflux system membrane fusion protein
MNRLRVFALLVLVLMTGALMLLHHDHDHDHDHNHEQDHEQDHEIIFATVRQARMAFSVESARIATIGPRLSAAAAVEAIPSRRVDVVIPARGTLHAARTRAWPQPGQQVAAGDILAELASLAGADDLAQLRAEQLAADARWRMARDDLQRVTRLATDGVVSHRRLAEAQTEATTAEAVLEAANSRLGGARGTTGMGDALPLRSPIAGTVIAASLSPAAMADAGLTLATILDDSRVWVRVSLLAHDLVALTDPQDLAVRQPGERHWLTLQGARLVYRGLALEQGVLPLIFEIDNDGSLPPGLPLIASLAAGTPARAVTIPEAALLSDDGVEVVIVQLDDEHFERRVVSTGVRAAGRVAVLEGVAAGDRLVVAGAYAVLLAGRSAAGGNDHDHHGHSH